MGNSQWECVGVTSPGYAKILPACDRQDSRVARLKQILESHREQSDGTVEDYSTDWKVAIGEPTWCP